MRARGPAIVAVLCTVPVVLWLASAPLEARTIDGPTTLSTLAVLLALAGASAFALNLVLGARLRSVDRLFGGLDKSFRFHRINGRIAFGLLVAHGTLILASRAWLSPASARALFSPASGWAVFLGPVALAAMAVSITLTLRARLGHELFVYVQRSFGVIFVVASFHFLAAPGGGGLPGPVAAYMWPLAGAGVAAWLYRSIFGNLLVRRYDYEIVRVRHLTPSVVEITMSPRGRRLSYAPGQFLFVTFYSDGLAAQFHPLSLTNQGESAVITFRPGDVANQFHPFSITSSPEERELRITVKAVGDFTTALQKLETGAFARVEGPYGRFSHLKAGSRRQIWLAGGIGITPFLSMARSLPTGATDVDFFFATKKRAEAYFWDELVGIGASVDGLRLHLVPEDEQGLLTADRIEELSGAFDGKDFLICGPPAMIDALRQQLAAKSVPARRIHFEKFGFTGPHAPRRRRRAGPRRAEVERTG